MTDFVLIHSTGQGAAGWERLAHGLAKRRHIAHAVELPNDPGLLAADFAELIRRQADTVVAPIVLAHSGSGPLLPAAATTLQASHQVWLAAWVPDPEVSFDEDAKANLAEAFNPEWIRIGRNAVEDDSIAAKLVFHDCDEETLEWALGTRRMFQPRAVYDERIPLATDVPSTYIVATRDRTIRPEWQRRMASERLGVDPIEIPSGHCPNVSQPERLAEILAEVAAIAD